MARTLSIFTTTFNLNGSLPSLADTRKWLRGRDQGATTCTRPCTHCAASDADLVFISLQECPTSASEISTEGASGPFTFSAGRSGPNESGNDDDDTAFSANIQSVLSEEHELVADMSMGANPNSDAHADSGSDDVKWYGHIRLLVYARGSELVAELRQSSVGTAVAVGTKEMSRLNGMHSNHLFSDRIHYHARGSPDKGAVCIALPTLKLMFVCIHLAGTNKYGVAERTFDRIRHEQLQVISSTLEDALQNMSGTGESASMDAWQKIIAGDFNFRVEVYSRAEHKDRGGRD